MRTYAWRALAAVLGLVLVAPIASQAADAPSGGLKAEYFANTALAGPPAAERVDATIDFAWESVPPAPGVGVNDWSARWTGTIKPRYSERYTLTTRTDDGVRLWIDGTLVIDDWTQHMVKVNTVEVDLVADQAHTVRMEFYEGPGRAEARLAWESASQPYEIVPASRLAPPAGSGPPVGGGPVGSPGGVRPVQSPGAPTTVPAAQPPAPTAGTTAKNPFTQVVKAAPAELPITPALAGEPATGAALLPPLAPPVAGDRFNAAPLAGVVVVRRPEDGEAVALQAGASLPVGTRIDTREGAVAIQTAPADGVARETQHAAFEGAVFEVTQRAGGRRIVGIELAHGDFESCPGTRGRARARAAAAGKRRGRQVRRLFGKGKGKFRTKGRFAAATVRGTAWTVADTCDETVARVHEGAVDVENLLTGRKVLLRAGERYAARAARR